MTTSPTKLETCENCAFGAEGAGGTIECRRFPPTNLVAMPTEASMIDAPDRVPSVRYVFLWPSMAPASWCGEWEGVGMGAAPGPVSPIRRPPPGRPS